VRIGVPWVGKGRDKLLAGLSERYEERLGRLATLVVAHVPSAEGAGRTATDGRRLEAQRLGDVLERWGRPRPGLRVALDERGEMLTTAQLASWLRDRRDGGVPLAAFVVGGDDGLDDVFVAGSDRVLALSRMTFTHEMARVLLLEQLYRAHALLAGHPYHRG
jgi:23S rRNA (pseudouridine1915-N3)-methyltransferase